MLNEKPALVEDIINKNFAKLPTEDKARDAFINVIDTLASREGQQAENLVARTIRSIEELVKKAQYIQAIDLIEEMFKNSALPVHHKSNLL